jgi:Flp pilus assembly protein TadD
LGWAFYKLGDLSKAEQNLRAAVRMNPGSETLYEHLGDVLSKQGKTNEARRAWQRALNLASESTAKARLRGKLK